jgi:hypothetical protein
VWRGRKVGGGWLTALRLSFPQQGDSALSHSKLFYGRLIRLNVSSGFTSEKRFWSAWFISHLGQRPFNWPTFGHDAEAPHLFMLKWTRFCEGYAFSDTWSADSGWPGPNPTKHDFPNFAHICKIFSQTCVKFLTNLWKINRYKFWWILVSFSLFYKYYSINWFKMSVKKRVLPNYVDWKLQICKMSKLHIFVITNICNQIFVTFGRIGTRPQSVHPGQQTVGDTVESNAVRVTRCVCEKNAAQNVAQPVFVKFLSFLILCMSWAEYRHMKYIHINNCFSNSIFYYTYFLGLWKTLFTYDSINFRFYNLTTSFEWS